MATLFNCRQATCAYTEVSQAANSCDCEISYQMVKLNYGNPVHEYTHGSLIQLTGLIINYSKLIEQLKGLILVTLFSYNR